MAQVRMSDSTGDQWDEMAKVYKRLTVDVSTKPVHEMLRRADAMLPFSGATGILDNGCGPGPIMSRILNDYAIPETCALTCADFSEGMIKKVEEQQDEKVKEGDANWKRLEAIVQDATDLKDIENSSFSHVASGWCYFMTSSPQRCLSESKRVLKDGGVLTCSSWKGSQWLDLMNLLKQIRPDKTLPEIPAAWREVGPLKAELEQAGFRDVDAFDVETKMEFETLETFVDFLSDKMPHMKMLTEDMSAGEMERFRRLMLEEGRKMCSSEPGTLTGAALVAVGRK